jgi:hypothetical protein
MDITKFKVVGKEYEIPIALIKPQHKLNCQLFDLMPAEKMTELKSSIETCGQDHPVTINQNYELVAGHNRYASKMASGDKTIVVKQRFFETKEDELSFMMRDNVVKRQLTVRDQRSSAEKFIKLYTERTGKKITGVVLSKTFGFSMSTANRMIFTERIREDSEKKSKSPRSAVDKKMRTIFRRHDNTLNEMRRCPKDIIKKTRLLAEKYVKALKKLEADAD